MPRGGFQTSLVGLINALTPFRRQSAPQFSTTPPTTSAGRETPGKGAPIYSYAWGQSPGYAAGARPMDITRFAPVFQPSGGLFAPGYPLVPVEYERTRRLNFPVGINTIYTPRSFEPIGFPELKALASDDITRLCIETRKDQIEKLAWVIKPRNEKDVARNAKTRVEQLTEFWSYPDGITPFATWLRQLMDQVLVADCPALEPRRNRGGDLIGLDIIEGSTIKVLIDDTGRRPRPPAPAFQQIIHGRPWVMLQDGSRTNTEEGDIVAEFTDQELIYFPRNPRADHLYGFSPVEQIVLTINTSIRRGVMQLQHFTLGNVPAGLVNAPPNWTPEQIAQYQAWFDGQLSGNTGERQKLLWGPEGAKYQAIKEAPLKDDFDEWRARVICFAFSLPPTAFTKQVNRATAETAQEAALEEGLAPLMFWVARLVNGIIQRRMGHPDLEFAWSDAVPVSPKEQADMVVELTGAGLQTLNEGRDVLGLGPVEGGDEILFKTASGPVTLDSVLNPPEPPPMPGPNGTPGQNGQNPPVEQGKPAGKTPPQRGKPTQEQGNTPPDKTKPGGKPAKPGEKPAGKPKTEVGKVADSPFGKRPKAPSGSMGRRNTALIEATRTRLQRRFETFFAERARDVAAQLARELRLAGWEELQR